MTQPSAFCALGHTAALPQHPGACLAQGLMQVESLGQGHPWPRSESFRQGRIRQRNESAGPALGQESVQTVAQAGQLRAGFPGRAFLLCASAVRLSAQSAMTQDQTIFFMIL